MSDLFVLNEVEVTYKHKQKPSELPKITCSRDAYNLVLPHWKNIEHRETFAVLFLSRGNRVLGISNLFCGGITGTVADVRVIYQTALKCNACSIILLHNHPSGTLEASYPDLQLTDKIKKAGETLDIAVLDHLIVTSESYLSLADNGDLN